MNAAKPGITIAALLLATAVEAAPYVHAPVAPGSITSWASGVVELIRGPEDINVPGSPLAIDGFAGNALGANDAVTVSLGDGGSISVWFSEAIFDGSGDDFAVFENAFSFDNGGTLFTFAELAFVAVSSNGTDWASFESTFEATPDEAFGTAFRTIDTTDVNNLAGLDDAGFGTGFDLSDLNSNSEVLNGNVDLNAIQYVRLIDVVGDGSRTDSFNNPIFDPYATPFSTSGFDVDAIGAINVVPLPAAAWLLLSAVGGLTLLSRRRS